MIADGWQRLGTLAVMLGLIQPCLGQSRELKGSVRVHVTDPENVPIPGASVKIEDRKTGFSRSGQTTAAGYYDCLNLPFGDYAITVQIADFVESHSRVIITRAGPATTIGVKLQPGPQNSSVDVVASPPVMKPPSISMGVLQLGLELWIALGLVGWLVEKMGIPDERRHAIAVILLGPLGFLSALAHPNARDNIGGGIFLALLAVVAVFAQFYFGSGSRPDWDRAEMVMSSARPGDHVSIREVRDIMGPPDSVTPGEQTTPGSQCYWWDNHGVLVSDTNDIIGTCMYVQKR